MNARQHLESAEELLAGAERLVQQSVDRDPTDPKVVHGLRLAELGIQIAQGHALLAQVRVLDAWARVATGEAGQPC